MNRLSFLRTSTFRLAAFYLGLFTLSVGAVLGVVWWSTAGFVERQAEQTIVREVQELHNAWRTRGPLGLLHLVSERSQAQRTSMIYVVATPRLDVVTGNLSDWPFAGAQPGWVRFTLPGAGDGGRANRPAIGLVLDMGEFGWMLVGHDMAERFELREQVLAALFWAVSLAFVVGLVGAVLISRRVARRIDRLNTTIDRITAGAFADRMPLAGTDDELDRLSAKLNLMLDEIGRLMLNLRQVTDNVAHDLRTPMSRLRSRLELALTDPTLPPPQRAALEQGVEEIDRMLAVFKAILDIAAAESGRARADFQPVDLAALAESVAELYLPVAEEKGLALVLDAVPASVPGSGQLLAQALSNLVENAIKYTPAGGRVMVRVRDGGTPALEVADTGPGVPADQRGRVLERFVRLEEHRGTPGHGLGLSLVAAVARLHGADLRLDDNGPGLRVTMEFVHPLDPAG